MVAVLKPNVLINEILVPHLHKLTHPAAFYLLSQTMEFDTDDEDRIRGCYNSHISVLRQARRELSNPTPNNPFDALRFIMNGESPPNDDDDYAALIIEDNISLSPLLTQSTLDNLSAFSTLRLGQWDMLHLAYIMYVPGLVVGRTGEEGVVSLTTTGQAALGTTCYVISKRGVDAILSHHDENGYKMPIPDLMALLFPESRYAANPMPFHRGEVPALGRFNDKVALTLQSM